MAAKRVSPPKWSLCDELFSRWLELCLFSRTALEVNATRLAAGNSFSWFSCESSVSSRTVWDLGTPPSCNLYMMHDMHATATAFCFLCRSAILCTFAFIMFLIHLHCAFKSRRVCRHRVERINLTSLEILSLLIHAASEVNATCVDQARKMSTGVELSLGHAFQYYFTTRSLMLLWLFVLCVSCRLTRRS